MSESALEHALEVLVDRLVVELADRVEARLETLGTAREQAASEHGLDVPTAAARLGLSERKVRELIASGTLPSVKLGRRRLISAAAVARLLSRGVSDADEPFALRWSKDKGWLRFRDPVTGKWDEVWNRDMPAWKRVLVQRLRDEGRLGIRHQDDDDAADETEPEHESCRFGLGLDCLNGASCGNPHHWRAPS